MPTIGVHVPDNSPLLAAVKKRAAERHDGKSSAYVRTVVERDLQDLEPDALGSTIVVDLTRRLLGDIDAREMTTKLGKVDQPRLLRELLRGFLESEADARMVAEDGLSYGPSKTILTVETGDALEERLRREDRARRRKQKRKPGADEAPATKVS